jgi:peptidoglycan/LPS O-acetylase OafA/YrhL
MNFRADINGLRAIAVCGVVTFHFLANYLPGGFAGVDVFFVISGFLMTSIIFRGQESGRFSIVQFYYARARRIVPALAVLCASSLALGWFYLHPIDFGTLGKHILGSLSFSSNIVYLKESGYFDEASKEKWLLHTWSLSVEWQFYIFYPLALVVLRKLMSPRYVRYLLVGAAAASLVVCVYASSRWPSSAFYLLPTRAWEMLAGGLVFLYPLQWSVRTQRVVEALGVLLIVAAYALLTEAAMWPGYLALIPVAGAMLVMAANRQDSALTSNAAFQWVGTRSYSIYLWHWPLVVWLNYSGKSVDVAYVGAGIVLSLALGALSYWAVESRNDRAWMRRFVVPALGPNLGWLFVATACAALWVLLQDGFDSRIDARYKALTQNHVMPRHDNGYCFLDFNTDSRLKPSPVAVPCVLGDRNARSRALLFGDSFAGHYEPFWDEIAKANNVAIDSITTNWCMPVNGRFYDGPLTQPAFDQCLFNREYLQTHMGQYEVIIFAGMWSNSLRGNYLDQIAQNIRQAAKTARMVVVMPPPVNYDTNVLKRFHRSLFYETPFDLQDYSIQKDTLAMQAFDRLRQDTRALPNVIYLERSTLFDPSGSYQKSGIAMPYSLDGMHITLEGSVQAAQRFVHSELYQARLRDQLVTK